MPRRRSENVIRGPNGEVIGRPREVATGLVSHLKLMVAAMEPLLEEMRGMVRDCQESRKEEDQERRQGEREIQWLPGAFDIFATNVVFGNVGRGGPGDPSLRTNPGGIQGGD